MISPVSIEPGKGVRLQLANYTKTRSFQGGGEFWETQFQQIIRQCLGDFLPRAEQDQPGSVLFQHFIGGEEVCSKSEPIDAHVPAGELQRIERCIQTLKAKETDPHIDGNARKLIQAFKLPDPGKDPELYRAYGPRHHRKLLVLWGVEKESLTSLDPMIAMSRVRDRSGGAWNLRWLWWLVALLLLLLIGWVLFGLLGHRNRRETGGYNPVVAPQAGDAGSPVPTAGNLDTPSPQLPTAPSEVGSPASTPPATAESPRRPSPAETTPPLASGNPPPASSATPAPQQPIIAPDANPTSRLNARPESTPTSTPKALKQDPGAAPKKPDQGGKPATAPEPTRSAPTPAPSPSPGDAPSPAPSPAPESPLPGSSNPPVNPPQTLEIITTSSNEVSKEGKVAVNLKAMLHDGTDKRVPFSQVTQWIIDGDVQADPKGKKDTTPALETYLSKGRHRVQVIGSGADGSPLRGAAEVEVGIETTVHSKPLN